MAKRSLDCSVQAADEEILKLVFDDVTGAWGLLLDSSARQSEDPDAKEMFQEASNYLDVLDFDKLNKKLFRV